MAEQFRLRAHEPGDIGWVIHRHGALYAREYGWSPSFEALVAEVGAEFLHNAHDRERCWIAEREGSIAGSIFLMRGEGNVAKLRLLYVEPEARGLGIGDRLVRECIEAARGLQYEAIELWTMKQLVSARRIYEAHGFALVDESPFHEFGPPLTAQRWQRALTA